MYRISDKKRFSHREQNMLSQKRNSCSQKRYFLKERKEIAKEKSLTSLTALISRSPTFPSALASSIFHLSPFHFQIYKKNLWTIAEKRIELARTQIHAIVRYCYVVCLLHLLFVCCMERLCTVISVDCLAQKVFCLFCCIY